MEKALIISVDLLVQEPYASVLCFPKSNETELNSRIEELRRHGVSALVFKGKTSIYGVPFPVLGKGYVGVVVTAYVNGGKAALKIRRTDADRADLLGEAKMLKKANSVEVGPKMIKASKNFLLMQLIEGDLFPDWLEANRDANTVKQVVCELLEQCFRLDKADLDHGELSKAPKHIIVDQALKPWIVDFETASDQRKSANVSAMCSFLFTGLGEVARNVAAVLGEKNRETIVASIKKYVDDKTRENFEQILRKCLG